MNEAGGGRQPDGQPTRPQAVEAAQSQALADAQTAAALLAIDPAGGLGLRLRGPADPRREQWLEALRAALPEGAPLLRMPLHIDDERLLGGLDLGATLSLGRVVAQAGLLTRCDGGVLLVAMAERVSTGTAARLSAVLDQGRVQLQRDGLVADVPTRFGVVALDEALRGPDVDSDEALAPALADRLAVVLDLSAWPMRLPPAWSIDRQRLAAARARLAAVTVDDAVIGALCQTADALGVPTLRAPLLAVKVARLAAAWAGHDAVDADDTSLAARLVLAPRATRLPAAAEPAPQDEAPPAEDAAPPDTPPDPPESPPEPPPEARPPEPPPTDTAPAEPPGAPPAPPGEPTQPLPEQVLEAALAAIPPGLLALLLGAGLRSAAKGAGKAGGWQAAQRRGRPLGSRRGELRAGARLHLIDTLRAAAPWQPLRRRELEAALAARGGPVDSDASTQDAPVTPLRRVLVRPSDFRILKLRERRETTTLFVVDASGSSALHRLAEAKGAIELLLAECYVRRDRVALIAFRGAVGGPGAVASTGPQTTPGAELLLPPTRSLARARRSLAGLPGGGGTPLAAGLDLARELAGGLVRRGGSVLTVLLTDGRANLARDGSPGRPRALSDALDSARLWRVDGLNALLLDTSPQPQASAQQVAQAMGARYLPLPHADARQMSAVVQSIAKSGA